MTTRQLIIRALLILVALWAAYLALGTAAWLMPDWRVRHHVQQTLDAGDLREDYPPAIVATGRNQLDDFTDALILDQALLLRSEGWKTILLLPRHHEEVSQTYNLRRLMEGSTEGSTIHYPRYWHCSTFVARLLLTVMSYPRIRLLIYWLTSLLMLWCAVRLWTRLGHRLTLALAVALLAANVYLMQFSLQFAPVLVIALGAIVWMTYRPPLSWRHAALLFLVVGSLTAAFDLITVPSLTLGLPLVVLVALADWRQVLAALVAWLVAYVATWAAKWGIATLVTGENIFADAYGQASFWSADGPSYIGGAIASNLAVVRWWYVAVPTALLALLAVAFPRSGGWRRSALFLVPLAIPFVYYVLMAHPAEHHAWFNYRALATAVAALLMLVADRVDWRRLKAFRP